MSVLKTMVSVEANKLKESGVAVLAGQRGETFFAMLKEMGALVTWERHSPPLFQVEIAQGNLDGQAERKLRIVKHIIENCLTGTLDWMSVIDENKAVDGWNLFHVHDLCAVLNGEDHLVKRKWICRTTSQELP